MKKTLLSLALVGAMSLAYAADNAFEVGIQGNLGFTDNKSPIKDNFKSYGLRANYRILENILVGVEYDRADNQRYRNNLGKSDLQSYFLNAEYEIGGNENYTPYAIAGIGYQDIDKEIAGRFESGMVAQVGAGWKWHLLDFLDLFVEGKYIRDFENTMDNFAMTAGLTIPFGGSQAPKAAPVSDSDNDGVSDDKDMCPNTPIGVEVDAKGCPIDSDHDGVPNGLDKCPNTPPNTKVDSKGCPVVVDSDHDGVPDNLDKCPDTPSGVAVDKHGCPIIINLQINFDFDSAKVKPKYMTKIKEVVEFLKANPAYKAEIQGHTDSTGPAVYNKKLSEKRAKAVYDIMVKMGIDPSRLSYIGYGEEHPIASNATPEGRAKNRRVEVHLLY